MLQVYIHYIRYIRYAHDTHYTHDTHDTHARYAFEIFDVDNRWVLEKPDLETMFKLLYNTEEHDETYIAKYPYSGEERQIHKDDFIDHSARKKKLVQPVIDYRDRLRNCMGMNDV